MSNDAIQNDVKKKRIDRSFIWSLLEQGVSKIVALVIQVVLARILMPSVFGVMAILLVLIEIANSIAQSGLGMGLIQKSNVTAASFSSAFWLSMAFSLVLYFILFSASPFLASFYDMPELVLYLRVLATVVFINAFNSIQRSFLQRDMDFKALFRSNTLSVLLAGVCSISAAFAGYGVWALIIQVLLQALIACIIMAIQIPWRPALLFEVAEAWEMFSYGWKVCVTGVMNILYTGLSELIIGKVSSASDLGFYSQGRKWPNTGMATFTNAIQNVLFPALSKIKNDKVSFQSAVRKSLMIGSYAVIPVCVLGAVIARPIIELLLTEAWLPCVPVFQLSCLGYILIVPQIVNLRAYMALGDSWLYMKLQFIKVLTGIVIICGVSLITKNIYWVATAVFLHGLFCVLIIDMHPAKRMHGIGRLDQIAVIFPIVMLSFASGSVSCAVAIAHFPSLFQVIIQIVLFTGFYLVGSQVFKVKGFTECVAAFRKLFR